MKKSTDVWIRRIIEVSIIVGIGIAAIAYRRHPLFLTAFGILFVLTVILFAVQERRGR